MTIKATCVVDSPTEDTLLGVSFPSSHLSVNMDTRIMRVPARDMTYQSTERMVTIIVHISSQWKINWNSKMSHEFYSQNILAKQISDQATIKNSF